jgi:hypothetical protein
MKDPSVRRTVELIPLQLRSSKGLRLNVRLFRSKRDQFRADATRSIPVTIEDRAGVVENLPPSKKRREVLHFLS